MSWPSCTSWLLLLAASSATASVAQADDELPRGVVVVVGDVSTEPLVAGARAAGGARWSTSTLAPTAAEPIAPPTAALERLHSLLEQAEFSRCLAIVNTPELDVDRLLAAGMRDAAARVLGEAAWCAFAAEELDVARLHLRRAAAAELDVHAQIPLAPPPLQQLEAESRQSVAETERVELTLETEPVHARIEVDGRPRCDSSPCTVQMRPGRHVVVAKTLGYLERVVELDVSAPERRVMALDRAPADVMRRQLGEALEANAAPDDEHFVATVAEAVGAPVVLLAWPAESGTGLLLYDRRQDGADRFHGRTTASDFELRDAASDAVDEWRDLEPPGLAERWEFWAILGAAVVAAGLTTFLLLYEPEPRYDLVGR